MRIATRLLVLLVMWGALAPSARAQSWTRISDAMLGQGGGYCFTDFEGVQRCIGLRCMPGQALEWFLLDPTLAGEPVGLHLSVDPSMSRMLLVETASDLLLPMTPDPRHPSQVFVAPFDPLRHQQALGLLRSGRELVLDGPYIDSWILPLRHSSGMIDHALQVCPTSVFTSPPAVAVAAPPSPPPAATPARPALPGFAAPAAAPPPSDEVDALTLRKRILDRAITWGDGSASVTFRPGGRFEASQNGHAVSGNWQMVTDGRICWNDGSAQGCFRFLRRGNDLGLRLENTVGRHELGLIRLE